MALRRLRPRYPRAGCCQDAMQPAQPATSLPLASPPGSYEVVTSAPSIERTLRAEGAGLERERTGTSRGWSARSRRARALRATHAFIWENGVMTDSARWVDLHRALYVNGSGRSPAGGYGKRRRACLLSTGE